MQKWPDDTFVLIPSYKSADLLQQFLPRLLKIVPDKQICIVDDASGDNTESVCASYCLTCIKHPVNTGKGGALDTGFRFLIDKKASWIITMDADGQHAPEDLNNFLDSVQKNPSLGICIGSRCMKIGVMPFPRICSNRITSFILTLFTGVPILDSQCGYRIYSAELLKKIKIEYMRFEMESEVIIKAANLGFQIGFTNVQTLYLSGLSHISHLKDTLRWVRAVIRVWFKCRKRNQIIIR
ncbi:MAG TPA: glycosyltransferase family 2 protein [Chitinispirillaceae bacterium]|nr:glycosyltransferase family 2 protein [Chitinispirillaceae bacterium]